ncbi:transglycosylase SLT domain-containing protein [Thiolapillus brandeum]|uniref:Lytic transglycosylase catalytic n=1 Tax=Thiolapillus brandeum TaxID=1076588 RepID=A0A7U6JH06_9GAMM|nr:transglycosylase SLT domain-containing protein [Thiolapillus brandeum]BAO43372.1 lytic transglycosylase catalytic [Thiolapillus brandeum]
MSNSSFGKQCLSWCRAGSLSGLALLAAAGLPVAAGEPDYALLPLNQLRHLAVEGVPRAQLALGVALEHGEGLPRSPVEARRWYCRAAAQNVEEAWFNLGWMFANGRGVIRDDAIARYWLGRAAAGGVAQAANVLAMLEEGTSDLTGCEDTVTLPWIYQRCQSVQCRDIVHKVEQLAPNYGLDANLVVAVIDAESGFQPRALSPKRASGLMQLLPTTAQRFGVRDIWDTEENLRGGMAYLRWLLAWFRGDLEKVLAAYNAGEQRVMQYRGVPPYTETRGYVRRILRRYGHKVHPYDVAWLTLPLADPEARAKAAVSSRRDP